jgi:hypothetical protein
LPFLGLIIGPYSSKNKNESLQKIFHVIKEKQPFSLNFKSLPTKKLRKGLIHELKDLYKKYQTHQDRINLKERWSGTHSREEKLQDAIDLLLQRNIRGRERHEAYSHLKEILNE